MICDNSQKFVSVYRREHDQVIKNNLRDFPWISRQARKARSRRLIQKGALLEKYFQADNLSVEQTEELLKIFANYVNAHKPNKFKDDQPNN